jgi:hypothetical protein
MVLQTTDFKELERGNVFIESFGSGIIFTKGFKFIMKKFGGLKLIPYSAIFEIDYSQISSDAVMTRLR